MNAIDHFLKIMFAVSESLKNGFLLFGDVLATEGKWVTLSGGNLVEKMFFERMILDS